MKKTALEMLMDYYGVEEEQRFTLVDTSGNPLPRNPFHFTDIGLVDKTNNFNGNGDSCSYVQRLLSGTVALVKGFESPELSAEEKQFLKLSIKFTPHPVNRLLLREARYFNLYGPFEYTSTQNVDDNSFTGLEVGKTYTLKELGLED